MVGGLGPGPPKPSLNPAQVGASRGHFCDSTAFLLLKKLLLVVVTVACNGDVAGVLAVWVVAPAVVQTTLQ